MEKDNLIPGQEPARRGQLLRETIRKNKFYTVVLIVLFLSLPLLTIEDINKVESGASTRESVVFPVGTIYSEWGYWPAVLFIPVCMLVVITIIIVRFILPRRK